MHPAGSQQDRAGCGPDQTTQGMTAQLKASPVVLGGGFFVGFFFSFHPFSFLEGACTRQYGQGLWGKGFVPTLLPQPSDYTLRFLQGSFAFPKPSLPQPSNTQRLPFNTLFQSQLN